LSKLYKNGYHICDNVELAMKKHLSIFLIIFIICGFTITGSTIIGIVSAESSIPKPDTPDFTVKIIDSSHDDSPMPSVNPFTGQSVTQTEHHVESRTIAVYIKRELITPFTVESQTGNWTAGLQYSIRWKGHFEQNWHEIYSPTNGYASGKIEGDYLVVSFEGDYSSSGGLNLYYQGLIANFPPNAQVDFQVNALIGYVHRDPSALGWIFTGEESGWSNTQTVTIDNGSAPKTPNVSSPNTSADQSGAQSEVSQSSFSFVEVGLFASLGIVVIAVVIVLITRQKAITKRTPALVEFSEDSSQK
jgi:hypothetical protein